MKLITILIVVCLWTNYLSISDNKPPNSTRLPRNIDKVVCNWCQLEFTTKLGDKNFKERHKRVGHEYLSYSAYGMKTSFFNLPIDTKNKDLKKNKMKSEITK